MKKCISILFSFIVLSASGQEVTEYPYFNSFQSSNWEVNGWHDSGSKPWEWSDSDGYQSSASLHYESTSNSHNAYLYSPVFRLDNVLDATLSFKYYARGSTSTTSFNTYFKFYIRVNQGPWQEIFFYDFHLNEHYWQGFNTQLASYLPTSFEPTILEFRIYCRQGNSSYDIDELRIDHFSIDNVQYRDGFEPGNYTAQYGWEAIEDQGLTLPDGKLAINSTSLDSEHELWVNGSLKAGEILVEVESVPDYVFDSDYNLRSLKEVESFIKSNHHLPGIPSESEMKATGANMGELNMKLLEKIEELTLYMISLEKKVEELQQTVKK